MILPKTAATRTTSRDVTSLAWPGYHFSYKLEGYNNSAFIILTSSIHKSKFKNDLVKNIIGICERNVKRLHERGQLVSL